MPKCPECGAKMKKRKSKYGPFWGCTKYPECKGTRKIRKQKEKRHPAEEEPKRTHEKSSKIRTKENETIPEKVESSSSELSTDSSPATVSKKFKKRKSGSSIFQISKYIWTKIFLSQKRERILQRVKWSPPNRLAALPITMIVLLAIGAGIVTFWPHVQKLIRSHTKLSKVSQTHAKTAKRLADKEFHLEPCTLIEVTDGDTIKVKWKNEICKIRLLRINTPEKEKIGYTDATRALEELVHGKSLYLEFEDPGTYNRDVYNRLLAYVHAEDTNTNIEMVRLGWSNYWTKYGKGKYEKAFINAEKQAQKKKQGMWKIRK